MLQGLQISSCEMEFTKARLLKLPPQVEEPLAKQQGKNTTELRVTRISLYSFRTKKNLEIKSLVVRNNEMIESLKTHERIAICCKHALGIPRGLDERTPCPYM